MSRYRNTGRALLLSSTIAAMTLLAGCGNTGTPQAQTPLQVSAASTNSPPQGGPAAGGTVMATGNTAPPTAADNPTPGVPPAVVAGAQPRFAQVVAVQPVTESIAAGTPHQVCRDEQVAVAETYKDKHQIGGAVIGGLVGAIAGHQVGGGKGRQLATVGGAAAGALAGHEIQKRHQENNNSRMETRNVCHTVTDRTTTTRTVAYDVTYLLNGQAGHVRMDHDPGMGTGLPVRDGRVAVGKEATDAQPAGSYYR